MCAAMGLADLFRPKWRHSKAAVRLSAVRALGADAREIIEQVARTDADDAIRKVAIGKLHEPELLASIASDDSSAVGTYAGDRAASLWQAAAVEASEAESGQRALAKLTDPSRIANVVNRGQVMAVREAALSRLSDSKALLELVHAVSDPTLRLAAVRKIHDVATLRSLALSGDPRDAAFEAIARLDDKDALATVAKKGKGKPVRARAKKRLEVVDPAPVEAPTPAVDTRQWHAEQAGLVEAVERIVADGAYDQAAAVVAIGETWARFDQVDPALSERLASARAQFDAGLPEYEAQREAAEQARAEQAEREEAAARTREAAAARQEDTARKAAEQRKADEQRRAEQRAHKVEQRAAKEAEAPKAVDPQTQAERFAEAQAQLEAMVQELEDAVDSATLRAAKDLLSKAATLFAKPPRLATKGAVDEILERYEAARIAMTARVQQLAEAEEWIEWSIRGKQKTLVAAAVALQTAELPTGELGAKIKSLQDEWKALRGAPSAKGRALWDAFRTACDAAYERVKAAHAENLVAKVALCERAEALADSTEWSQTATALKELQAEWKTVGPAPRAEDRKVWERFRVPCDAFFERRKVANEAFQAELVGNGERKQALIDKVEALADQVVDRSTHAVAKRETQSLQRAWRDIGHVPARDADTMNKGFRAACDAVFNKLDAIEREQREAEIAKRIAECEAAKAVLESGNATPAALVGLFAKVQRLQDDALIAKAREVCVALLSEDPAAFAGTELDPATALAKKAKLCERVEAMAPASPSDNLADQLQSALANNALGGRSSAISVAARLGPSQAAWSRVGPTPGADGAAMDARWEAACAAVLG